jgi:hypothetical protein
MELTQTDAYALRLVSESQPLPENLPISPIISAMLTGLGTLKDSERKAVLHAIINGNPEVCGHVGGIDLEQGPPHLIDEEKHVREYLKMPELPRGAHLDERLIRESEKVGHYQNDFTRWLQMVSPTTPQLFLESGGVWTAGLAIAKRCYLRFSFDDIFPNLYFLWLAPTTYYHKTTALKAITQIIRATMPHLLLPESMTPEVLMAKLAGLKPFNYQRMSAKEKEAEAAGARFAGQRGVIVDEASKLFISKKYMEGYQELIMQLFDAPDRIDRELRTEGVMNMYDPALSIIGATTPSLLHKHINSDAWETGFMARFGVLSPKERDMMYTIVKDTTEARSLRESLEKRLRAIYEAFPMPPARDQRRATDGKYNQIAKIQAQMDEGMVRLFEEYARAMHGLTHPKYALDERLRGNYGRFPVMAAKMALNFAVMDWIDGLGGKKPAKSDAPSVTPAHWAKAQLMAEEYRESAHRVLAEMNISLDIRYEQKILDFVSKAPPERPPSKRDIQRGTGIKDRKDVYASVDALVKAGLLKLTIRNTNGRGPTTEAYVVVKK